MRASYEALVDIFECIENFLRRLSIYTEIPLTSAMTEMVIKLMVELLAVLALATKQISQGRFSMFCPRSRLLMADRWQRNTQRNF